MLRVIAVVLGVVTLTGCVSTKNVPLHHGRAAALKGSTLTVTKREKPSFAAMTAGKAMLGIVGATAMIVKGNNIIEENHVDDPAGYIADALAAELATAHGMTIVPVEGVIATSGHAADLSKLYRGADVVLDVQTVNWSFVYYVTDLNNYQVIYTAKLRLIDTRNRRVLAEGFCPPLRPKAEDAPGYDELLANQAARLKQELRVRADRCIADFRDRVLMASAANAAPAR